MNRDRITQLLLAATAALAAANLLPWTALGNDSAFGGHGSNLRPVDSVSDVRMASETIELQRDSNENGGEWRVRASYEFENTADEAVDYQVGFPEPACPENIDCSFSGFEGLSVRVDGDRVELKDGSIADDHPWSEETDKVYLFDVTFGPDEPTSIVHTFSHQNSSSHVSGGETLTYVTRTGAAWKGTIGKARFEVELPYRPWTFAFRAGPTGDDAERELELVDYHERIHGNATTTLVFEADDWEPSFDFELDIRRYMPFSGGGPEPFETLGECPSMRQARKFAKAGEEQNIPKSKQILSEVALSHSAQLLRRCRNAVYARHGYDFNSEALDAFFYGADDDSEDDETPEINDRGEVRVGFRKNPHFSADLLTDSDTAYAELIKEAEGFKKAHQPKSDDEE